MEITESQKRILSILSAELFQREITEIERTEELLAEAKAQAVLGIVNQSPQVIANNMRVNSVHALLTNDVDVPFVTIKGYVSAMYYPTPVLRQMGDVDFIVGPQDYEAVKEQLLARDYRLKELQHVRHAAFKKKGVGVELHKELNGMPNGMDGIPCEDPQKEAITKEYLQDLIEQSVAIPTDYGTIRVPSEFHHGLIMLLHVGAHMMKGGVGLRHLCDWAVYVNRIDFEKYKPAYEKMGLWRYAQLLSLVSVHAIGLPYQEWMGQAETPVLDRMLEDILSGGNFGRKEKNRHLGNEVASQNFFTVLAKHIRKRYPWTEGRVWLMPVGLVFFTCRYFALVLTGKKTMLNRTAVGKAQERVELYKEFELFK